MIFDLFGEGTCTDIVLKYLVGIVKGTEKVVKAVHSDSVIRICLEMLLDLQMACDLCYTWRSYGKEYRFF